MSRNIKEIGKELMGKSLNSFHRKTGLTQLEKNNEMQDGILNGILSQVDDAYIEKTEQSNVIHLDGSGDGVVVLDSIEGNTMVNEINSESLRNWTYSNNTYAGQYANTQEFGIDWSKEVQFNCWLQAINNSNPIFTKIKPNTDYTVWINILENNPTLDGVSVTNCIGALQLWINGYNSIRRDLPVNTKGWVSFNYNFNQINTSINYSMFGLSISGTNQDGTKIINGGKLRISKEVIVLEGLNTPLNKYFEGLQSSFEEKVNDEGKYEIEILSNNKNLFDIDKLTYTNTNITKLIKNKEKGRVEITYKDGAGYPYASYYLNENDVKLLRGKRIIISRNLIQGDNTLNHSIQIHSTNEDGTIKWVTSGNTIPSNAKILKIQVHGHNSVGGDNVKGNTTIYENIYIGLEELKGDYIPYKQNKIKLLLNEPLRAVGDIKDRLCVKDDKLVVERNCGIRTYQENDLDNVDVLTDMNNTVYILDTPIYDEVTNEYGEPIILEGYENGTLYIDSTIIPTTTVKYTPKMEPFNTLKEVVNNNIMLTNDVNDNIIPYMMDVDLMIMEKEMALMSHKNIRKMEVLDMTSMQKRTQDMLERLIKGKSLTEQECKTRVTTYLHAGKIIDEQAEELMLLIDEVYA